jgi:GxxExxY protein
MGSLLYEKQCYELVGLCMEVHRELGPGFSEVIYKDALEIEFKNHNIPYAREKEFIARYKGQVLKRKFNVDFVVFDSIIFEAKAVTSLLENFVGVTVNYLKLSGYELGIIGNFGEKSFRYRRVILT